MIFVNLSVKDLDRSKKFFSELGYSFKPQFSDENSACLVISDTIYAMLLTEESFAALTKKQIADTSTHQETLIGLSADSRQAVDELVDRALAAGGTPAGETVDTETMYDRSFRDLDGHHWEITWIDPAAAQG
ncbi:hypothetical protein SAMN06297387_11324 [Streptomyces zhaozhouensis]|uniref:VOC domain-containing protein n=1 Tax=Streptomyces zhaozhouensis TaxID=1300267 RepID=A0A286DYY0_9ACTN|nr:VOC family protein [Streptomyces zhaozhouensis]SOD63865.1 hypothetical protein SAMN06297387_11324 [Streptomyces zhaozhouensis]